MLVAVYHPARWNDAVVFLFNLVVILMAAFGGYVLAHLLLARSRRTG